MRPHYLLLAITVVWQIVAQARAGPWLSSFQSAFRELKEGKVDQALNQFNSLWRAYPKDVQLATSIGGVLDATNHHDRATVWYRRALAIEPDFGPALEDLALNCTLQGKLKEAADLLRRKLAKTPSDAKAVYNLGLILLRLQRFSEASATLSYFDRFASGPVPPEQIRLAQSTALFHLAQYGEAAKTLLKSGTPHSAAEYQLLGSAQALSGDLPASIKTFQNAIEVYPDEPGLYFRLTMVFADGRRDQDAKAVLQAAAERMPHSSLIDYGNALVAEMGNRDEEAISWAQRSISASERRPEVWGLLGTLYDRGGKTEEALRAYERALEYGGDGPYIGNKYAELLIRLARYSEARAELRRLAASYPTDALVNRALGKLYRAEGAYDKAEQCLRRSIKSDPSDAQAHYALAQVLRHQGRAREEAEQLVAFKSSKEKADTIRLLELVEITR